jgi:immune inhibitor A
VRHGAASACVAVAIGATAAAPAGAVMPPSPETRDAAAKAGVPAHGAFPALLAPSPRAAARTIGDIEALVLLIDFADNAANLALRPPAFFETLAFAETGKSLSTFYQENSYGQLRVTGSVSGWLRSGQSYRDYYVNRDRTAGTADDYGFDVTSRAFDAAVDPYPKNVWGIVMEAATLASATVRLADYDGDGDGRIDALVVVHSGAGAEERGPASSVDDIWSHKSSVTEYLASIGRPPLRIGGVEIDDYLMAPETGRLGVVCHEFGHILGLPDLYRTDASSGQQESVVGSFDLMDNGGWLDRGATPGHLGAWCKYQLGWIDPIGIETGSGRRPHADDVTLFAAATSGGVGAFYRLLENSGGADWAAGRPARGEYFLLENRVAGQFDFDSALPGSGLVIWHVDESRANNNAESADEHLVTLVQADGDDYSTMSRDLGEPSDLWPGAATRADFTARTTPSASLHGGAFSGVEVTDIRRLGEVIAADLSVEGIRIGAPYAYPNPLVMGVDVPEVTFVFQPRSEPDAHGDAAGATRVRVFDLSGSLVNTLLGSGGPLVWDCRNAAGRMVASGTYVYVVESHGESAEGKIAIVH